MTDSRPWLLYGATGYTGELIAREAVRRGLRPILAGRSQAKVAQLAAELQCPSAVFSLDDHTTMLSSMQAIGAVLHCAGPFAATARSMMQACLASHVHYFDITGEIDVFELAHSVHDKAQRSGIVLCPGVGFDVVPTDCVALKLKETMPDATHLTLAFDGGAGVSKGTAKTAIDAAGDGLKVRREGKIVSEPLASHTRRIDFGSGEKLAVGIPWGDVSTAFYSTGIPNIDVLTATTPKRLASMRRANSLRPLLRQRWFKTLLKYGIDLRVTPPDATERSNNPSFIFAEVRNAAGQTFAVRFRTANGYALTVSSALAIVTDVLHRPRAPGFATPSMLMGSDFVTALPGFAEVHTAA